MYLFILFDSFQGSRSEGGGQGLEEAVQVMKEAVKVWQQEKGDG